MPADSIRPPHNGLQPALVAKDGRGPHAARRSDKSFQKTLTKLSARVILNKCLGVWCNGNTWVSKTFVEGSSPSAPAKQKRSGFSRVVFAFQIKGKKDSNGAVVNDMPFGMSEPP